MEAENDKKIENNQNLEKFAKNLEYEFSNFGENSDENGKNEQNTSNSRNYACPEFVLNYLQDKPVWLQKRIICKGLSPDQIKEVEYIFKPSVDELRISREVIKKYIEKLINTYPELEKYMQDESVFLAQWSISFYERRRLTLEHVASKKEQIREIM